ncbi:MAG: (d)CMP kinase [Candidatus Marinimicrobia bacterium]|nr:(d)CMP kinase [Candidatus Neomarinimicrobiota bacterium]
MGKIIAIDGPAGSGKSSTAREVAKRINFVYIDTGAMYRAVTLLTLENNIPIENTEKIIELARKLDIHFEWIDNQHHTFIGSRDITQEIRTREVADLVSPVSVIPEVREHLAALQRRMGEKENIVMEGRDIGTNVFPDADLKFFMVADLRVRAQRRIGDYQKAGQKIDIDEVIKILEKRDKIDSSRAHSPLKKADDAIELDTSHLTFEEQVRKIIEIIQKG